MFVLIGYLVVILCVFGGFAMAGGHLAALFQPVELLMIGGAAIGAFIVSNNVKVLKATLGALGRIFKGSKFKRKTYVDVLTVCFLMFTKIRQTGAISIEDDVENPENSPIFSRFPDIMKNHHLKDFLLDYFRMLTFASLTPTQIEALMESQIDSEHHEELAPVNAITKLADGMPAFGIVAAVMGVVHTMESVSLPPAELGILIAHALVGTFLGILLGYGFVGPLAPLLESYINEDSQVFHMIKRMFIAFLDGYPPTVAIEFGRKMLPINERPDSPELEAILKASKSAPAAGGEAAAAPPPPEPEAA